MAKIPHALTLALLAVPTLLPAQELDQAEVRIPYGELKQLLARAAPAPPPPAPAPALLSGRLRLTVEDGQTAIEATFRTTAFSDDFALVPLTAGDITLDSQVPEDAVLVMRENFLCLAIEQPGIHSVKLRLLSVTGDAEFTLNLPPCPSLIFETGTLPDGQSVSFTSSGTTDLLTAGSLRALPSTGQALTLRLLDGEASREASRPPEPSTWTWQNQALVIPADGELIYQTLSRASAADGSGVAATLALPADALDITITGEDLLLPQLSRGESRTLSASLVWGTRGILDRQILVSYRMPLRPLDRKWQLQAPGPEDTRTRFILATSPFLAYASDGLSVALTPRGIPQVLASQLQGDTCHFLESGASADLSVTPIPVAATADGVVSNAEWALKIEPDGAMLATGALDIAHKTSLGFEFDTPEGMRLLSCDLNGKAISPVDLGAGKLKVALAASGGKSRLECSFTGNTDALDPVEGTVALALPRVPLFIHALAWQITLPTGYQAETHGNLKRARPSGNDPSSRVTLHKNLCRDERPEVRIFYQRSDLNR